MANNRNPRDLDSREKTSRAVYQPAATLPTAPTDFLTGATHPGPTQPTRQTGRA